MTLREEGSLCLLRADRCSSRGAVPHKMPQCHQLGWRFSANTRPGLGAKLKASMLELGKRGR